MDESKRRRTEITIEKISVTRIRSVGPGSAVAAKIYCQQCGEFVSAFEAKQVATIIAVGGRDELDWENDPDLHQLPDGRYCTIPLGEYLSRVTGGETLVLNNSEK
jgi:hypothetical protein